MLFDLDKSSNVHIIKNIGHPVRDVYCLLIEKKKDKRYVKETGEKDGDKYRRGLEKGENMRNKEREERMEREKREFEKEIREDREKQEKK